MELNITKGDTQVALKLENSDAVQKKVVDGVFQLFGIISLQEDTPAVEVKARKQGDIFDPVQNIKVALEHSIKTYKQKIDKGADEEKKTRSRQLPLLGAKSEGFSLMEKAKCKTKIECPCCGGKNTIQVPYGYRYTFCPDCHEKLFIRSAGENWGEADFEGNVYIANEVYIDPQDREEIPN